MREWFGPGVELEFAVVDPQSSPAAASRKSVSSSVFVYMSKPVKNFVIKEVREVHICLTVRL